MFIILIKLFVVSCFIGIQGDARDITPAHCDERFCESPIHYPTATITNLVVTNQGLINRMNSILIGQEKTVDNGLCECNKIVIQPLVGLNVYNEPIYIVNIDNYTQTFVNCQNDLGLADEFHNTECSNLSPKGSYRSMCMPIYQNVFLLVMTNDQQLQLDEFYTIPMYKCVIVPED